MSRISINCIKAAFICLALGIGLGAWFAIDRGVGAWLRPLHAALNLWGWTTLLIYGMAYHMVPRFTGRPLLRSRLAEVQSWLAFGSIGLIGLGWVGILNALPLAQAVLLAGGVLQVIAALLFALLAGELLSPER